MKRTEYLQIFGFIYSKRKGTPAEKMLDQVDEKIKKDRLSRLLDVKNEIIKRMKTLRESLLDDDLIIKTDKIIKDEIKSFLKENL